MAERAADDRSRRQEREPAMSRDRSAPPDDADASERETAEVPQAERSPAQQAETNQARDLESGDENPA